MQTTPQNVQPHAAEPAAANGGLSASLLTLRTVAMSLLVDRALSA
jgi:hypothetical protein